MLAFVFLFSPNLSFSIETKQRKGSLLNDANRGMIIIIIFFYLEIWFRFWYCGLIGFDLGRTDAWHWFVKPLLFLIRVILSRVPMVVFLWFFKFLNLNHLTNLPSLAHIFFSCWPLVLCSSILYKSTKVSFFFLILCFLMKFRWIPVAYFGFSIVIQVLCIRINK